MLDHAQFLFSLNERFSSKDVLSFASEIAIGVSASSRSRRILLEGGRGRAAAD
jgi:hypothetical protein